MSVDQKTEVTATVLGKALGLSRKRVEQLAAENVVPRSGKGRFPLLAGVAGYVSWLRAEDRQSSKSAAASRLQDQRSEEIELRLIEKRKTLVEQAKAEAFAVIDDFAGALRTDLLTIPSQVTKDIALRRQIEKRIDAAFGASSRRAAMAAAGGSDITAIHQRTKPLRPTSRLRR